MPVELPPGDTVPILAPVELPPGDTVRVPMPSDIEPGDTVPQAIREAAAQTRLVPVMPDFPSAPPAWSASRWTWTRADLAMIPGLTLLDLIGRLPGFVTFGAGDFGRPVGLTAAGMGGGRLRVTIDGYELDPYDAAAYPLETIPLVDLAEVTVERTLSEIRVEIRSFRLESQEPYSEVQLGTGPFQNRLLRALFSRGFGTRTVGTGAFDLAQTGGIGLAEPYATRNINFRLARMPSERSGLGIEFRNTTTDRSGDAFPLETTRTDLVLRGRRLLGDRFVVEGIFGRTNVEGARSYLDPDVDPDGEIVAFDAPVRSDFQAVGRGAYTSERLSVTGGVRSRFGNVDGLPTAPVEADVGIVFRPFSRMRVEAAATAESGDAASARAVRLIAALNPHPVFTVFGSVDTGTTLRTLRFLPDATPSVPPDPEQPVVVDTTYLVFSPAVANVGGYRAGVEIAGRLGSAGAAVFNAEETAASGFGLPWDIRVAPFTAGAYRAIETYFDVPLIPGVPAIRLDGWYTRSIGRADRRYAPADMGRFGLRIHDQFIGGQLEPYLRLELVRQAPVVVPLDVAPDPDTTLPVVQTMNLEFRLRILDVQAFMIWNNLLLADLSLPLPGAPVPRSRLVYGASWRFRN